MEHLQCSVCRKFTPRYSAKIQIGWDFIDLLSQIYFHIFADHSVQMCLLYCSVNNVLHLIQTSLLQCCCSILPIWQVSIFTDTILICLVPTSFNSIIVIVSENLLVFRCLPQTWLIYQNYDSTYHSFHGNGCNDPAEPWWALLSNVNVVLADDTNRLTPNRWQTLNDMKQRDTVNDGIIYWKIFLEANCCSRVNCIKLTKTDCTKNCKAIIIMTWIKHKLCAPRRIWNNSDVNLIY